MPSSRHSFRRNFSRIEPKLCSNLTSSLEDASVQSATGLVLSNNSRTDGLTCDCSAAVTYPIGQLSVLPTGGLWVFAIPGLFPRIAASFTNRYQLARTLLGPMTRSLRFFTFIACGGHHLRRF